MAPAAADAGRRVGLAVDALKAAAGPDGTPSPSVACVFLVWCVGVHGGGLFANIERIKRIERKL